MALAVSILCLSLCVTGVAALSIVALEGNENPFDLVYLSSNPTEIRAFQLYLKCDDDVVITGIEGVEPFQVFYGGASVDDDKVFRISGFATESPGSNQKNTFAKIFTSGKGTITIFVEVLSDFSRKRIISENQDESYLVSGMSTSTHVIPTAKPSYSSSPTPSTQGTAYQTTTMVAPSSVSEEASVSTITEVPLSSSSLGEMGNPNPMPTQTPLELISLIFGLTGAFIMFKRQKI